MKEEVLIEGHLGQLDEHIERNTLFILLMSRFLANCRWTNFVGYQSGRTGECIERATPFHLTNESGFYLMTIRIRDCS